MKAALFPARLVGGSVSVFGCSLLVVSLFIGLVVDADVIEGPLVGGSITKGNAIDDTLVDASVVGGFLADFVLFGRLALGDGPSLFD
jgi:hypothetical protein